MRLKFLEYFFTFVTRPILKIKCQGSYFVASSSEIKLLILKIMYCKLCLYGSQL